MVSCWKGRKGINGCHGATTLNAFDHLTSEGIPDDACYPYSSGETRTENPCYEKCIDGSPIPHYKCEANTTAKFYKLNTDKAEAARIKTELYKNGPTEVSMKSYDDLHLYKSGVYRHVTGKLRGGHAIKLIGWGVDPVEGEYWICANSWGPGWGMDGFVKVSALQEDFGYVAGCCFPDMNSLP